MPEFKDVIRRLPAKEIGYQVVGSDEQVDIGNNVILTAKIGDYVICPENNTAQKTVVPKAQFELNRELAP